MNPTNIFQNLLDTHSDKQVLSRHSELISEYINIYGFTYSPDKSKVIGKIPDNDGNLMIIEEIIEIDVTKVNLETFSQGLYAFKKELNQSILEPNKDLSKLEYLKIIKLQLDDLQPVFEEKLNISCEPVIKEILIPAINFTSKYIDQLNTIGIIAIESTITLNWNANVNMITKFINEATEPHGGNNNEPLITNKIEDIVDFIHQNFTWKGNKFNKETINRSLKPDKVQKENGFTRIRNPKKLG
jgi:hypothetical protein